MINVKINKNARNVSKIDTFDELFNDNLVSSKIGYDSKLDLLFRRNIPANNNITRRVSDTITTSLLIRIQNSLELFLN